MIWKGPDRFLLVGLSESSELQRSFLRFKTAEEASRAASAVREVGVFVEEPPATVEEIQVQVRFLYTLGELLGQAYIFSIRLLILGFIAFVLFSVLDFGPLVAAILIVLYFVVFVWGLWERTRRRTGAWLRFEEKSFAVRTEHDWRTMVPNAIEWKSAESFVLKGFGTKVHVSLPTEDDAAQVVQRLRSSFPEIKEAPLKTQR